MRYKIWQKDDFFLIAGQRIDMDPAVVELPSEPAALSYNYNWAEELLGTATDIRLEDGEITGEVEFFKSDFEKAMDELKDDVRVGGYYTDVKRNEAGDRVLSCKLRGVSFIPLYTMPGYRRNDA